MAILLTRGNYDNFKHSAIWNDSMVDNNEGYVLRAADTFCYKQFKQCVGKFVRQNHVQHWRYGQQMARNEIKC